MILLFIYQCLIYFILNSIWNPHSFRAISTLTCNGYTLNQETNIGTVLFVTSGYIVALMYYLKRVNHAFSMYDYIAVRKTNQTNYFSKFILKRSILWICQILLVRMLVDIITCVYTFLYYGDKIIITDILSDLLRYGLIILLFTMLILICNLCGFNGKYIIVMLVLLLGISMLTHFDQAKNTIFCITTIFILIPITLFLMRDYEGIKRRDDYHD